MRARRKKQLITRLKQTKHSSTSFLKGDLVGEEVTTKMVYIARIRRLTASLYAHHHKATPEHLPSKAREAQCRCRPTACIFPATRVGAPQSKGPSFLPAIMWSAVSRPALASSPGTQFPSSANSRIQRRRRTHSGNSYLPPSGPQSENGALPRVLGGSREHGVAADLPYLSPDYEPNGFLMWTRQARFNDCCTEGRGV